jgi:uncharacterized membrane protein HdeD (DUF308 family)
MGDELADVIGSTSKSTRNWGIATLIIGILAIAAPLVSGVAVAMLVGLLMLLAGIAQTIYAFRTGSLGAGLMVFLFGGITIFAGIAILVSPVVGLATLTVILIAYFLVDGVSALVTSFRLRPAPGWGWMAASGAITILLALMIWQQWPVSGVWAIGTLVGVRLILSGMAMIGLGAAGKDINKAIQSA